MRLKMIILILALFGFLSASTGGLLYYNAFKNASLQTIKSDISSQLHLIADRLSAYLSEYVKPTKTLSQEPAIEKALRHTSLETLFKANQALDRYKKTLEVDVCYLLTASGITLCSSNRNEKDSFIGHDFSFRPYFTKAVRGKPSTYLALGTTSGKRGVYYAHPVYESGTTDITGVVVLKASVEFVEKKLFKASDDILIFTSPQGVVFISNKSGLRFKTLWAAGSELENRIIESRQFGNGPWKWSGFSINAKETVIDRNRNEYVYSSVNVAHYPGWQIVFLRDKTVLQKQLAKPFARILGAVIISIMMLTAVVVFILYQLGIREITRRRIAEKELRLSEERYRHIYHKTPVMLHSIDTEGKLIRVSDHWVDVMGYTRKEVIGRHLTEFFTPESREHALNVIFPKFFQTGFCKDIPYTFVKKNKETIDTLLSCYGVRDERGDVVRSLAVSVDVTEKNRAQNELEIATEKLSLYSTDLEQQVEKRTAQLLSSRENLKRLSKNIIAFQEKEKAQVARELHDHLGQVLTALRIDAVWCEKFINKIDADAAKRALRMCTLIDETINDVRDMAYRLRPRVLDDLGLTAALESLLSEFERRSNVSCVFKTDAIPDIDDTLSTALYRIAQEAVTNALRHSNATTVELSLYSDTDGIVLEIQDDGCGFELKTPPSATGFGLEGMKERAKLVGGKLEITSAIKASTTAKQTGTLVCCKVKVKG